MHDPGLQAERTALAWQRTGISSTLVGGLAVLTSARSGSLVVLGLTAALVTTGAATAAYAARPSRPRGPLPDSPWGRLLATVSTLVLLALSGVLIALA
jgi:uncharacterized membrane protein YidH (DUF202 family)